MQKARIQRRAGLTLDSKAGLTPQGLNPTQDLKPTHTMHKPPLSKSQPVETKNPPPPPPPRKGGGDNPKPCNPNPTLARNTQQRIDFDNPHLTIVNNPTNAQSGDNAHNASLRYEPQTPRWQPVEKTKPKQY